MYGGSKPGIRILFYFPLFFSNLFMVILEQKNLHSSFFISFCFPLLTPATHFANTAANHELKGLDHFLSAVQTTSSFIQVSLVSLCLEMK